MRSTSQRTELAAIRETNLSVDDVYGNNQCLKQCFPTSVPQNTVRCSAKYC